MELYFAYGSNMLARQMLQRCPSARPSGIGELTGFRLTFNRKGSYREGAVASVEVGRRDQDRVLGAVWRISRGDLERLDAIEDPDAYVRLSVPIRLDDHRVVYSWMYVSFPDGRGVEPDDDYLRVMIEGARELGLPLDYLETLRAKLKASQAGARVARARR